MHPRGNPRNNLRVLRATAVALALLLGARAAVAAHTPDLTRAEERCQRALGRATDVFGARTAVCITRCDRNAFRHSVAPTDCRPPFGGRTQACVAVARSRAAATIDRDCAADCPECYAAAACPTYRDGALAATGVVIDRFVRPLLCDDTASADGLTAREARCRQVAGKTLGRLAVTMGTCIAACRARETRGKLAPGACTPATLEESAALACVGRQRARGERRITAGCGEPPECLAPALGTLVAELEAQVLADYRLFIFCAE